MSNPTSPTNALNQSLQVASILTVEEASVVAYGTYSNQATEAIVGMPSIGAPCWAAASV